MNGFVVVAVSSVDLVVADSGVMILIGEEVVRMKRMSDDLIAEACEEDGVVWKFHDVSALTEMRDGVRHAVSENVAHVR